MGGELGIRGCGTALVTPFRSDGTVDDDRVRALVGRQLDAGVDFLVPGGTTGEGVTLTLAEQVRLVRVVVDASQGSVPVVAGCAGNATAEVVPLARALERAGASALLCVTPYYNKPTPSGLELHYRAVASATRLPVVVYNVPSRTGTNVTPSCLLRLAKIPGVVAVKEASGDIAQVGRILATVPDGFGVFAGDDASALATMALGGCGVISVVANQIPREMTELCALCLRGDMGQARILHRRWLSLMEVNFCESSPGPVKFALARMGLLDARYRPPMTAISEDSAGKVSSVMASLGLLDGSGGARPAGEGPGE